MPSEVIVNDQSLQETLDHLHAKIDSLAMSVYGLKEEVSMHSEFGREVFLSCKEASELLGVSRSNLQSLINDEEIPSIVLRGRRLIPRNELTRVLYDKCVGCCPMPKQQ